MKFIKIYFFALLIGNISFSQEKISFFHYALNSHIESPDTLEAIWGMELEFTTKRTYLDDSIFIESRLFTGDDDKAIEIIERFGFVVSKSRLKPNTTSRINFYFHGWNECFLF